MLYIIEALAIFASICFGVFAINQIVVPLLQNRPVFPFFRSKVEKELSAAERDKHDAQATLDAARLRAEAVRIKMQAAGAYFDDTNWQEEKEIKDTKRQQQRY